MPKYGSTDKIEWTAEIDGEERDVLLTYSYTPGSPEYIPYNSCPSNYDPGSAAEIELISCDDLSDGQSYILTNDQLRKAEEFIEDRHIDDTGGDPDWERDNYMEWER